MDIERLKDARHTAGYTTVSKLTEMGWTELREISKELIDEAISRQSVKSEDVAEAIGDLLDMKEHWCADSTDNDAISIDLAIAALQAYQPLSAIKWTGDNLREVISMTGWNESASSKWTWEEYEQIVKEKGLKIFTPDGSVMAGIGDWIVRDGNDCHVLQAYQPWVSVEVEKPESERPVLLLCEVRPMGRKYICDGFYVTPKSVTISCDDESNYEYDEETDEYYLVEGFYENIYNWCDYTSVAISDFVVGWKPLPPKGE